MLNFWFCRILLWPCMLSFSHRYTNNVVVIFTRSLWQYLFNTFMYSCAIFPDLAMSAQEISSLLSFAVSCSEKSKQLLHIVMSDTVVAAHVDLEDFTRLSDRWLLCYMGLCWPLLDRCFWSGGGRGVSVADKIFFCCYIVFGYPVKIRWRYLQFFRIFMFTCAVKHRIWLQFTTVKRL